MWRVWHTRCESSWTTTSRLTRIRSLTHPLLNLNNMAPPILVLNGYPLLIRHKGVGAYTLRLIRGLLRHVPEFRFRVLMPEPLVETNSDLPLDIFDVVRGT